MFVEKDISPQIKRIGFPAVGYRPLLCDIGLDVQVFIQLDQAVIELVTGPKVALVLGKSRVEGRNIGKLVVAENQVFTVFPGIVSTGKKEKASEN